MSSDSISMGSHSYLDTMVAAQKRGEAAGIPSICSANPFVLRAVMQQARQNADPILIESTSNQVNQYGGYMGLTPAQFRQSLWQLAGEIGIGTERIILGGDHLGPNAWQREPADTAMAKAQTLVADCVRARYTKIHLDASMRLGGDPAEGAPVEILASRAAALALAAESAWQEIGPGSAKPRYIIGTEVPIPGGELGNVAELQVTTVASAQHTLEITESAFRAAGLEEAWQRVIGLVVQPGVEFGDRTIHPYQREKAVNLTRFIEGIPGIVFEAHSTDYQAPSALRQLVEDHFAILKVGPGLTFAFREVIFALESIEAEILTGQAASERSHLQEVVDREMLRSPGYWQPYYTGTPEELRYMRRFSFSDRIRYYWSQPAVAGALDRLLVNLKKGPLPTALISQYLPGHVALSAVPPAPEQLISAHIQRVMDEYRDACYDSGANRYME